MYHKKRKLYYIENIKVNIITTDSKMRKSINLNLILNEVQVYDKLYSVVNQAYVTTYTEMKTLNCTFHTVCTLYMYDLHYTRNNL